jgi:SAM-dependent methyltransferase
MEQDVRSCVLNLGCGFRKFIGAVNVDAFENCNPDIVWDLNKTPWEWARDGEYDQIYAWHVMEHLPNWWGALSECARILKPGGTLEIRVPDESSSTAMTYRDHHFCFTRFSFHGIADGAQQLPARGGTNAWAMTQEHTIPLRCLHYRRVPFKK